MNGRREIIAARIERLISLLDAIDGDPDFEMEPFEEQHDAEADLTWTSKVAPPFFVLAERARRRARTRH